LTHCGEIPTEPGPTLYRKPTDADHNVDRFVTLGDDSSDLSLLGSYRMLAVRRLSSPVRLFGCAAIAGSVVLGGVITSSGAANAATSTWHNGTTERAHLSKQSATQQAAGFARSVSKLGSHGDASANQSAFAPADAPTTTPTSVTVTGTSGELSLDAVSTAAFVEFTVDGTNFGTPVAVTGGNAATTPFDSWGYSNDDHLFGAADCTTADVADCNLPATVTQTVTLANAAPVITAPADAAFVSSTPTLTATADGGGIQFQIDGARAGFVGSAPYTLVYAGDPLSAGPHTVTAEQCSINESVCIGPVSASITVKVVDSLHPSITTISPSTFSPNKDGVKDTAKITYDLPDTEAVSIKFTNSHGTLVRGPISLGTLGTGAHSYTWNGHGTGSSTAVPSGKYTVTISTSATVNGIPVTGSAARTVTVDDHAPVASKISALKTFYPHKDGYRDTFPVSLTVNERAAVTLSIRTTKNKAVRTISTTASAGTVKLTWNGHDSHGHAVKSGAYHWYLTLKDTVGNHTKGATHKVTVSPKKLVSKSTTITKNGDAFTASDVSDSCAVASTADSVYAHGIWLANFCDPTGDDIAMAEWRITVPSAISYTKMSLEAGGFSSTPPASLFTGFGKGGTETVGKGFLWEIQSQSEGYYSVGSVSGSSYVSAGHHALVFVAVDPLDSPCEFDIHSVRLKVTYKVLK
jgi:flagellar hook assembly protein FlgD